MRPMALLGYEQYYQLRTFGLNLNANGDFNPFLRFNPQDKRNNSAWNAGIRGRFETFGVTHQLSIETMRTKGLSRQISRNTKFSRSLNTTSNLYNPIFVARPAFDDSIKGLRLNRFEVVDSSIALADTMGFLDERLLLDRRNSAPKYWTQILQLEDRRTQKPIRQVGHHTGLSACWSNPGILCLSMATISKPLNADPLRRGEPSMKGKYFLHP